VRDLARRPPASGLVFLEYGLRYAARWSYRHGARWALLFAAAGAVFFCVFVGSPRGLQPRYLGPDGGLVEEERT
jgi:hypothetical protein